jgi:SAM-dependent methyltransferase
VAENLPTADRPLEVLDAGCGQGTQALRLAAAGHHVVGIDTDERMLAAFRAQLADGPADVAARVDVRHGRVEDLDATFGVGAFDVVLCHGVLMYLTDPEPAVHALAVTLRPGGVLSLLARNQPGIAMRAGHRGRWPEALAAVRGDSAYVNELGVPARADTVSGLTAMVGAAGLAPRTWYGIRALSDMATLDAAPPPDDTLSDLLAAEELAGRTDPYRAVAPLVLLIAERPARD